tara:strand:+ start:294 stop:980 length:687 start_codon:yes stop_codon:yes gene_type:complete
MTVTMFADPDVSHQYVMGVDTAEGLAHGDYSVIQVLDVNTGEQAAIYHAHIAPDLLAEEVFMLGLYFNDALCCVESNNHGLTTITELRHLNYPRLFRRRSLNQVSNRVSQEFGWKTTRTSKPLMIDELGSALRNDELVLYDKFTIAELRTFVRNERGSMSGSPYDDRVMALALANQMRKYAHASEYKVKHDDYWTLDWFARLANKQSDPGSGTVIGASTRRGTPNGLY